MEEKHFEALYPEHARFTEIEQILEHIQAGNFCQIVGVPGIGKGALLRCLTYNRGIRTKHLGENQKWLHFVLVNCKEVRNKPFDEIVKLLFISLVHSAEQRQLVDHVHLKKLLEESLRVGDELLLLQNFKKAVEMLAVGKELTVVFLLEQFQTLVPTLSPAFFTLLSDLKEKTAFRFSVVFSINRPLEQMVDAAMYEDVYPLIAGHTLYPALRDEPSLTFRLAYLQRTLQKTLPVEVEKEIFRVSGGLLKMVLVAAEEVLRSNHGKNRLWEFFLENKAVRNASYEIWNALSPQEQAFLRQVSLGKALSEAEQSKAYLESVHVLDGGAFTIPLFEAFVQYRAKHLSDEQITFRAETNDILKGEQALTAKLTASEFRLLRYLLEHPDTVIERDAVVDIAWKEAKSTAGVTDQAIDQLVFRLRRKVEDDPNFPKHLLTVKGRGIRFVP